MSNGTSPAAKAAKQKWNATNYTQVKISVAPAIAETFKKTCSARGQSIAGVLIGFMKEYVSEPDVIQNSELIAATTTAGIPKTSTLKGRRTVMTKICRELTELISGEAVFMQNVPDNLQNSENYAAAEARIESLEEALELLSEIYV